MYVTVTVAIVLEFPALSKAWTPIIFDPWTSEIGPIEYEAEFPDTY